MAYKRKRKSTSHRPILYIFTFALVITLFSIAYAWRSYSLRSAQSATIFQLEPAHLQSGPTTLSGVIRKDAPLGESGSYLLILDSGKPILLDLKQADSLVGKSVTLSGNLNLNHLDIPLLIINSITFN